jgi:hypothetical protein
VSDVSEIRNILLALLSVGLIGSVFAADRYPLTMTAVFTEGKITNPTRTTYRSGDYDCTSGDEHNAPVCHTTLEWAEMDGIGGSPNTVVFTLEDGSTVNVQSMTLTKIPDYIECAPSANVIFCSLYFELLGRTQISPLKPSQYGQTVQMSPKEYDSATEARHLQLFGNTNRMTASFQYRLRGRPAKDGFQRIEIDPHSCIKPIFCNAGFARMLNPRGDGYYMRTP